MSKHRSYSLSGPPHVKVGGWNLWLLPRDQIYLRSPNSYEGGPFDLHSFEGAVMEWNTLASGRVEAAVAELIADFYSANF